MIAVCRNIPLRQFLSHPEEVMEAADLIANEPVLTSAVFASERFKLAVG